MLTNLLIIIAVCLLILFPVLIHRYTNLSVVRRFIEAGAVIPVLLFVMKNVELVLNKEEVPLAILYGMYLWPSSILLMGIHGNDWGAWLFFLAAISLNALLYSLIGYLAALSVFFVKKTRTVR